MKNLILTATVTFLTFSSIVKADNVVCGYDKKGTIVAKFKLDDGMISGENIAKVGDERIYMQYDAQNIKIFVTNEKKYIGGAFTVNTLDANKTLILDRTMVSYLSKGSSLGKHIDESKESFLVCYNMKDSDLSPLDANYKDVEEYSCSEKVVQGRMPKIDDKILDEKLKREISSQAIAK